MRKIPESMKKLVGLYCEEEKDIPISPKDLIGAYDLCPIMENGEEIRFFAFIYDTWSTPGKPIISIQRIYLLPKHRDLVGRRIARELGVFFEGAEKMGVKRVIMETNKRSRAFFKRRGLDPDVAGSRFLAYDKSIEIWREKYPKNNS